jgi:hypothetical protein
MTAEILLKEDLIKAEAEKLILTAKNSLQEVKRIAVAEAWKILQLATASIIQIIEALGDHLSSPEKKQLAMNILDRFYDNVFLVIDIPFIPKAIEPFLHKTIKSFFMILLSSTIDALVTTFRNTGVFFKQTNSIAT